MMQYIILYSLYVLAHSIPHKACEMKNIISSILQVKKLKPKVIVIVGF